MSMKYLMVAEKLKMNTELCRTIRYLITWNCLKEIATVKETIRLLLGELEKEIEQNYTITTNGNNFIEVKNKEGILVTRI